MNSNRNYLEHQNKRQTNGQEVVVIEFRIGLLREVVASSHVAWHSGSVRQISVSNVRVIHQLEFQIATHGIVSTVFVSVD